MYVGKAPGEPGIDQEAINRMLVRHARAGRLVVRLKGGDPMLFGRAGEEAEALADAHVPFRIVPGVTAAAAAAACAAVPLTDRRCASSVVFVTGRQDPGKADADIDWPALARVHTLVLYMGVGRLAEIVAKLIQAGRGPKTPAVIVASASTPRQRVVAAPLDELPAAAAEAGIEPPAITIVGEVAAMRDRLAWFEHLPLFGQTVVVTRPAGQAGELAERLSELGAAVVEAPAVEILPPADFAAVDAALRRLGEFDWIVLTSVNGVAAFARRCRELNLDARSFGSARVAAVGPATADALAAHFIRPDVVPETFTTEALAEALMAAGDLAGREVLLARADIAGPQLPERLGAAGADVTDLAMYRTARPAALPEDALAAIRDGRADWITFTSSSAVTNFLELLGPEAHDLLGPLKLAAIGPVTAGTIRSCDLTPTVVAARHTIEGLVDGILDAEA